MYTEIIDKKRVLKENIEFNDLWESLPDLLKECHFRIREETPMEFLGELGHIKISGLYNKQVKKASIFFNTKGTDVLSASSTHTSNLWIVKKNESYEGFQTDRELADLLLNTIREEWNQK